MSAQKPNLPDGTWAVTKEDKEAIVKLGRELTKFLLNYAQAQGPMFHTKIVAGGFQYFMDLQNQKAKLIGDDILITQAALEQYSLGNKIDEPFTEVEPAPAPAPETAPVAEPVKDTDVEDASLTPDTKPVTVDPSKETA
jgi:hypothetical protein